eukprot:3507486-Rhodomonas_salina.2
MATHARLDREKDTEQFNAVVSSPMFLCRLRAGLDADVAHGGARARSSGRSNAGFYPVSCPFTRACDAIPGPAVPTLD